MPQKKFAAEATEILKQDPDVIGLAVGGSWLTNELDEYSDLDLIIITREKIGGNKEKMLSLAQSLGDFISGFTGEHVGEPRLLICLYDNPLLHVDLKFLTLAELETRIEDPFILFERDDKLSTVIHNHNPQVHKPDLQWIEDRFWTWVHYTCTKIGRGELFDVLSSIDFFRVNVLSPMMQLKNNLKSRGARKVEKELSPPDLENLKITVAQYDRASTIKALDNIISIYRSLRRKLFDDQVVLQSKAEKKSMEYFKTIKNTGRNKE